MISQQEQSLHEVLPDGTQICVRPLRGDDRAREIEFLESLSERTRYLRLLTPLRYLPPHLIDSFMDVDGRDRVALVATINADAKERFIGVARYAVTDDPQSGEIGITVSDAWQRRGVAAILLKHLSAYARAAGLVRFTGFVLPENSGMLALARSTGFRLQLGANDRLMHIELSLAP